LIYGITRISDDQEASNQTCKSDWHKCVDNADLVNNSQGMADAQTACKLDAQDQARFGTPQFPIMSFESFYKGDAYVKSGIMVLLETRAQYQNVFGAMVHSTVTCTYDLNQKKVTDIRVGSN
jgi:hypothetical protein